MRDNYDTTDPAERRRLAIKTAEMSLDPTQPWTEKRWGFTMSLADGTEQVVRVLPSSGWTTVGAKEFARTYGLTFKELDVIVSTTYPGEVQESDN